MQHIDILNFMKLLNNDLKLYIRLNKFIYTALACWPEGYVGYQKNYSTKRHKSYSKKLGAIYVNFIIAL